MLVSEWCNAQLIGLPFLELTLNVSSICIILEISSLLSKNYPGSPVVVIIVVVIAVV